MSYRLSFKCLQPYKIYDAIKDKGKYILEKLDKTHLSSIFIVDKIKIFHPWWWFYLNYTFNLENKELPNLDKVF